MSEYGNINFEDTWYDEPITAFLQYKRTEDKITDKRFKQIENILRDSPNNKEWQAWDEFVDWRDGMTIDDARAFKYQLEDSPALSPQTVEDRLTIVKSFLAMLLDPVEAVDSNPVAYVLDRSEFDYERKRKIDRTIAQVGSYLRAIPNLQQRAIGVTFAKTGIRLGENINIDLADLHLDDENYYTLLERHDVTLVDEIRDHPDTLYISSEPTIDGVFRGEKRLSGNKRKRDTRIPVDGELKRALLDWLAVRPETRHPHPLWVHPKGEPTRIGKENPNRKLTNYWAEETGFVEDGDTEKLTSYWFRHFFSMNMKPGHGHHDDSIAPSLVKYIRGDIEDDIMDVYTHDWKDQVRKEYLDAIYQFGIYD